MKNVSLSLLVVVLAVVAILGVRTAHFSSRQETVPINGAEIRLELDRAVRRLSEAIQFKTIAGPAAQNRAFSRLHHFLRASFPRVHAVLQREVIGGHSLLYTWRGSNQNLKPILLMAHLDVVPADPSNERHWTHPPFSGRVADGYIWGRGAIDDKASVLAIFEAVEYLLAENFRPKRSVYLAFGHDEERGGNQGAGQIAALLLSRRVKLEFVLDEGGNITQGIVPGVERPVALVGIAEKGYASLQLTVTGAGGHSSIPPARTAIGVLSDAVSKLERSPFPTRLSEPTRRFFEYIGPELEWLPKTAVANLWLFEPLVRWRLDSSPLTAAMIRTTQAATIFHAGVRENVLPSEASAVINFRILTGDTLSGVLERVRDVIANPQVKINPLSIRVEPSPASHTESEGFKTLARTIRQVAPQAVVAPFLLVAATDSRHYAELTPDIFRFLPITLGPEDAQRFHGLNERISIQDYDRCVRFYIRLLRNVDSAG